MNKYRYYIIHTSGNNKEVYGVIKETKKNITVAVIQSNHDKKIINKIIVLSKTTITNNLSQFDFTTTIEQ